MNKTLVFTDGSSRGNPGPGGWGSVIVSNKSEVFELGGREDKTTNNRMEMMAAIEALGTLIEKNILTDIELHTDSSYLLNGITKWVSGWKKNGWHTRTGEEVLNRDLWEKLDALVHKVDVSFEKVVGHSGHALNERCDEIATSFADKAPVKLYNGAIANYAVKMDESRNYDKGTGVKKTSSSAKAYSYVSLVDGVVQVHKTWGECERRVKGARGARYRKALDAREEKELIALFQQNDLR
jgi:ribonuclease HI